MAARAFPTKSEIPQYAIHYGEFIAERVQGTAGRNPWIFFQYLRLVIHNEISRDYRRDRVRRSRVYENKLLERFRGWAGCRPLEAFPQLQHSDRSEAWTRTNHKIHSDPPNTCLFQLLILRELCDVLSNTAVTVDWLPIKDTPPLCLPHRYGFRDWVRLSIGFTAVIEAIDAVVIHELY